MFSNANLRLSSALLITSFLLLGCNTYEDVGKVSKSVVSGYSQYSNKTINMEVLTPKGWGTEVTIGGEYIMTPPNAKKTKERKLSIAISSFYVNTISKVNIKSPIAASSEDSKNSMLASSTTLEDFKNNRLAFLTEENIGPQLSVSTRKTRLAKHDAYEISYSYKVKEITQRLMFQETFTLVDGKVYRIIYYSYKDRYKDYLKKLQVIKSSYRILK